PPGLDDRCRQAGGARVMNQAPARDQDRAEDPSRTKEVDREFRGGDRGARWRARENRAAEWRIRHEGQRPGEKDAGAGLPPGTRWHRKRGLAQADVGGSKTRQRADRRLGEAAIARGPHLLEARHAQSFGAPVNLRWWLAQRDRHEGRGRAVGHGVTVTLGKTRVRRRGPAAAPARLRKSWLARRHLEQPERGALRIGEDRETSAGEFHRRDQFARAGLRGRLERLVDVGDREVHEPVAGHLRRYHGLHLLAAGDALAAKLELGIGRVIRPHVIGLRGPAEYLLIEGNRLVDAARAEL